MSNQQYIMADNKNIGNSTKCIILTAKGLLALKIVGLQETKSQTKSQEQHYDINCKILTNYLFMVVVAI